MYSNNLISQSVSQSVSPSVRQSVSPSVRQSVSPSVRQSVSPSVRQSVSPSVRQSVSPSVRQSVSPSVRQFVSLSVQSTSRPSSISALSVGQTVMIRQSSQSVISQNLLNQSVRESGRGPGNEVGSKSVQCRFLSLTCIYFAKIYKVSVKKRHCYQLCHLLTTVCSIFKQSPSTR